MKNAQFFCALSDEPNFETIKVYNLTLKPFFRKIPVLLILAIFLGENYFFVNCSKLVHQIFFQIFSPFFLVSRLKIGDLCFADFGHFYFEGENYFFVNCSILFFFQFFSIFYFKHFIFIFWIPGLTTRGIRQSIRLFVTHFSRNWFISFSDILHEVRGP